MHRILPAVGSCQGSRCSQVAEQGGRHRASIVGDPADATGRNDHRELVQSKGQPWKDAALHEREGLRVAATEPVHPHDKMRRKPQTLSTIAGHGRQSRRDDMRRTGKLGGKGSGYHRGRYEDQRSAVSQVAVHLTLQSFHRPNCHRDLIFLRNTTRLDPRMLHELAGKGSAKPWVFQHPWRLVHGNCGNAHAASANTMVRPGDFVSAGSSWRMGESRHYSDAAVVCCPCSSGCFRRIRVRPSWRSALKCTRTGTSSLVRL